MKTWFRKLAGTVPAVHIVCVGLCLSGVASAGGNSQASTSTAAPATLYHSYCSVCHGDHGDGQSRARASLNPPPLDFTNPAVRASLPRERMIIGVREGRPGTAMVGWKTQLSDTQIAAVVDYVREKFMTSTVQQDAMHLGPPLTTSAPRKVDSSLPTVSASVSSVPVPPKGNMVAGGRLYEQNCVACHGKAGDGRGPRAYFISPRPRSFVSAESRAAFSRPILIHAIAQGKRGTEMPSWDKVLTDQEIADVAEFVFQRFVAIDATIGLRERK